MDGPRYLSYRLKELFLDGHWIANTNYQEVISQVNLEIATHKLGSLNTIAELVYHIQYYLDGLCKVFNGEPLSIKDSLSFNLPPLNLENDWLALRDSFIDSATRFVSEVANMENEWLDKSFVEEKYGTWLRNIDGVLEHSYYHLGQIVLIKKMIKESGN
jgi:hypothetical protein